MQQSVEQRSGERWFVVHDRGADGGNRLGPGSAPEHDAELPVYGPSSGHSAIVNHLMADGSVHCLSKQIDCSAYMFLITKNGSDPNPPIP